MSCSSCRKPNQTLIKCNNCRRESCDDCWGTTKSPSSTILSFFLPFPTQSNFKCPFCGSLGGDRVRGDSNTARLNTFKNS